MKPKLFYVMLILFSFSCKPKIVTPEKIKKIAVHTFTGRGEHDETTNWFYIRNVADRGLSGYYLESPSKPNNFKQVQFIYSKTRPLKFEEQYASGEKVEFLGLNDLPDNILKDSSDLESLYE